MHNGQDIGQRLPCARLSQDEGGDPWREKKTYGVAGKSMIPSGKRLQNYGKSPFLMGKSTINGHVQ